MTEALSHTTRSARKPTHWWTDEDQLLAEVAAACGVSLRAIGKIIGSSGGSVGVHLMPGRKEACRIQASQWAKQNPERHRDNVKSYRRARPAATLALARRWRHSNRDACNEYSRKWSYANPEKRREKLRNWQRNNRQAAREHCRRRLAIKRTANIRAIEPATLATIRDRFTLFGGRCAYCSAAGKMTVDHVLALKHGGLDDAANIVPACPRCNSSKHARPVAEWFQPQPFFTEARWRKLQRYAPDACAGQPSLGLRSGSLA